MQIIKPSPRRGNFIGLLGSVLIFVSAWLDTDKHSGPRTALIVGCCINCFSLLNHILYLFTKEAKESIWSKGGLISLAITPAPRRGLSIGMLGLTIMFLGMGLIWLDVPQAFYLALLGWVFVMLGMVNHWRWFCKPGSLNIDS